MDALNLWDQDKFISALTLAGAAEGILGEKLKQMNDPNRRNAFYDKVELTKCIYKLLRCDEDEKSIIKHLNEPRNEVKHWNNQTAQELDFEFEVESAHMIRRAYTNFRRLNNKELAEIECHKIMIQEKYF
ncbi:MAG: hypothetical protein AAGF10_03230 [Verrucomicrobiota bacterium]